MFDFSFPKSSRLLNSNDYQGMRTGSSSRSYSFIRVIFRSNNRAESRLGLSISSKHANSVYRNKFKRTMREMFRLSRSNIKSMDILIIARKDLNNTSNFDLIKRDFSDFLMFLSKSKKNE